MGMLSRIAALTALTAALGGCDRPVVVGSSVNGSYELSATVGAGGGQTICFRTQKGCDIRVPPAVVGYGVDEDFVTAAVMPAGRPEAIDYYFIVRLFDYPEADGAQCLAAAPPTRDAAKRLDCSQAFDRDAVRTRPSNCAVRGPFNEAEFHTLRRCHCVPEQLGAAKLKCIPAIGERRA